MVNHKIVVGDADGLIALAYKDDANHTRAKNTTAWLMRNKYEIVYPNTAILESITALKRALNLDSEARLINNQYRSGAFLVEYINAEIQRRASLRFEPTVSKKNTIFDAIVVETAVELKADYIFSFDNWYPKEGFKLAPTK